MARNQSSQDKEGSQVPNQTPPTEPTGGNVGAQQNKDSVTLPKETLNAILTRLENLEAEKKATVSREERRDKEIEMLKSVADKARLAHYDEKNRGVLIPVAKVAIWDGFPILGWTKGVDEVGFRDGRLQVRQTIKLFVDKGDKEPDIVETDYLYWAQNVKMEAGEVTETAKRDGSEFWKLQLKDGKVVTLDIRFINAF